MSLRWIGPVASRIRAWGAVACALVVASIPASAAAQDRPQDLPRVLFLGVEPTSPQLPELVPRRAAERIAADLATDPSILMLSIVDDPADAAAAPPPPPPVDRTAEARVAMVKGRELLAREPASAEAHAREAIAALLDSAVALDDFTPLVDAHLLLGESLAEQKRDPEARAAFLQLFALAPATPPDPRRLGKRARKVWDQTKREYDRSKRGGIRVEAVPSEATAIVSVDGFVSGEAPVDLLDQGQGWHIVQVTAEGFRPWAGRVDVSAGLTVPIEVILEPTVASASAPDAVRSALRAEMRKRARGGVVDASAKPILARLAERVGATHLLIALLAPTGAGGYTLRTFLYRADGSRLVELDAETLDAELLDLEARTLSASRGASASIRRFPDGRDITTSITAVGPDAARDPRGGLIGGGRTRDPVRERDDEPRLPVWKNAWFWVGVGGVIVGGVAMGFLIASSTEREGYDGTVVLP